MELAKRNDEQSLLAAKYAEMLTKTAADAWPDRTGTVTLCDAAPDWSGGRWAMSYWQAPEDHEIVIAVPEAGIEILVDEAPPGFEQAAPLLQWESHFWQHSEQLWNKKVRWELAELEVVDAPDEWLARHNFHDSFFAMQASITDAEDTRLAVYFLVPPKEIHSVAQTSDTTVNSKEVSSNEERRDNMESNEHNFQLPSFDQEEGTHFSSGGEVRNIDLIMDVPLTLTVELGRTVRSIREIVDLAPGSLIELDRMAGESVDVLINNRLVAKGEVVVIDENFGVRITDIVSPKERLQRLG